MSAPLELREAEDRDAYALWVWANDPETRKAAFGRAAISWSAHKQWLAGQLASGHSKVFMGMSEQDLPIGSIRFDTTDDWRTARLSYVVAPESRGCGYGRSLIETGLRTLRASHPAARVWAEVAVDNEKSLRVFRAMGWPESAAESERSRLFHLERNSPLTSAPRHG